LDYSPQKEEKSLTTSTLDHTPNHLDCPVCNAQSFVKGSEVLANMSFTNAFEKWINTRVPEDESFRSLSEESVRTYRDYAWALGIFFGSLPLNAIHDGHLRSYQDDRAACRGNWKKKAGRNRIRKEIGLLQTLMRLAKVWDEDLEYAYRLPRPEVIDVQRVLEPSEETTFLEVLRSRNRWHWLHDYTIISLRTCMSTLELRSIKIGDVNFNHRTILIRPEGAKTKYRVRTIPIETADGLEALTGLLGRAKGFGAKSDSHYLFPFGADSRRGDLDVTLPMTKFGTRSQWRDARKEAGVPWLRPYDLRHTAITRMAETGVPIATIMIFAGHVSPRMTQHYTAISMQAKRLASAGLPERLSPNSTNAPAITY
jgi:integrase